MVRKSLSVEKKSLGGVKQTEGDGEQFEFYCCSVEGLGWLRRAKGGRDAERNIQTRQLTDG